MLLEQFDFETAEDEAALRTIEESFHPSVAFSAQTGDGVSALWDRIRKSLEL